MHASSQEFLATVSPTIGWLYAIAAGLNGIAAVRSLRTGRGKAAAWGLLAIGMVWAAWRSFAECPPLMPHMAKDAIDAALGPRVVRPGLVRVLAILYVWREFFTKPDVAWAAFNGSAVLFCLSLADPNFAAIVSKADNVPIVAMVLLLGYFTWLGAAQAVENDRRVAEGFPRPKRNSANRCWCGPTWSISS